MLEKGSGEPPQIGGETEMAHGRNQSSTDAGTKQNKLMKKKPTDAIVKAGQPKPRAKSKQTRHGPEPERIKFQGNWIKAVDIALKAKRPPEGWPK